MAVTLIVVNAETVLFDVAELARLKISERMGVDPEKVTSKIHLEDGKAKPEFNVMAPVSGAWESQHIRETIADVWLRIAKPQLEERLRGLNEVRHGYGEEGEEGQAGEED